ncbi:MAG: hypothetical protein JO218_11355 [Burkholderiales bacterium]|nr:hypothetical protein [Burkholderiales bacterium]
MALTAHPVPTEVSLSNGSYILRIEYVSGNAKLIVTLADSPSNKQVVVTFYGVSGFRVLDEGDLLEFWPECSKPNGWFFRIQDGGWYQQECARSGFLMPQLSGQANEYLITGSSDCISVLDGDNFEIEVLEADDSHPSS